MIGRTLAHFKIVDRLGAGGMGEVFLAKDTKLDRLVALKLLPEALAGDPDRLERLEREAKALAALDHPHIVTVFSVEEDEGTRFLTMAYVEGESLEDLIPEGGLSIERLLEFGIALIDALRTAHERGIIHRDLKPSNVMIDREGRLRVLDFGLAKRALAPTVAASHAPTVGASDQMTRAGAILGSYPYMSPEQAEGRPVDARSDLFSFGVMFFEMATGRRPFGGDTGLALMSSILRDQPPSLTEVRPDLPRAVEEILDRCLAKRVGERYQSAQELLEALRGLAAELAAGVAPIGLARAVDSSPVRARSTALAIAALVVVLLLAWLWFGRGPPETTGAARITSLAVLPLKNLSGDPDQDFFVNGMTEALITDLSKIGALTVISRSSAMIYKDTQKSASRIGRELGVDALVDGSVLREGDRVGITTQLIATATNENLWAERYDRELTSILSLQSEIARTIAAEIQIVLTPEEESLLADRRNVDPAAQEAYLRGMFHLQQFSPQDFDLALRYYETALEIEPDYAPAQAGIAQVWLYRNQFGLVRPADAIPKARAAVDRALELDKSLAQAHLSLAGIATWYGWDWTLAEASFLRAIELQPSFAEARVFYAHCLAILGRANESTEQIERALELDPLNPFFQGLYAIQLSLTGDVDAAISHLQATLETAPGFDFGRPILAYWLHVKGRETEALDTYRAHLEALGDREALAALELGLLAGGYREAMRALARLESERSQSVWVSALQVSMLYELAGDYESAFEWLERGLANRDPDMPYLAAAPHTEELGSDPRFEKLLAAMKLPT